MNRPLVTATVACAAAAIAAMPAAGATRGRTRPIPLSGTVYVESNSTAHDSNEILAFRYRDGVLSARGVRRYPTGGSGSHDLSNSGVLDADQESVTLEIDGSQRTVRYGDLGPGRVQVEFGRLSDEEDPDEEGPDGH